MILNEMNEKLKKFLQAMAISALLFGLRIFFLEIPQILSSKAGSIEEIIALDHLMIIPFYFVLTTAILYCIIA
jgi:hypothetical protein